MDEPKPPRIAARWIGAHAAGAAAIQLLILALPALDLRDLAAQVRLAFADAILFGVGHAAAVRWVGWPVRARLWAPTTVLGITVGVYLGNEALAFVLIAAKPDVDYGTPGYYLLLAGACVLVFLTSGLFLVVPQGALVARKLGRSVAVSWAAWALAGWMAAEFLVNLPLWSNLDLFKVWPLNERWIVAPCSRALWAALFALITLPGLCRVREAASTSR